MRDVPYNKFDRIGAYDVVYFGSGNVELSFPDWKGKTITLQIKLEELEELLRNANKHMMEYQSATPIED